MGDFNFAGFDGTGAQGTGVTETQNATGNSTETSQTPDAGSQSQQTQTEQTQQNQQTQPTQQTQTQDEMLPKSEIQKIIQARLAEEKRKNDPYKAVVDRLQKITGMDANGVTAYLDQWAQSQQMQQQQQVDPRLVQAHAAAQSANAVAIETRRMLEESELTRNPIYSDYADVRDAVREYADQRGTNLQEAYWAVNGPARSASMQKEAEQRALEAVRRRGGLNAEGDGSTGESQKLGLSPEEIQIAKISGMDPKDYAAMKNFNDYGDYQKAKRRN